MAPRGVRIPIVADAEGVKRGTKEAEDALGKLNQSGKKSVSGLSGALRGVGGAFAAIGVIGFAKDTIKAAEDAQASATRVQKAVQNAGLSYTKYGGQIDSVIQKQSQLAALDDEDLADSFAKIVTGTKDVNEALKLNALAADVARGRQISLEAATQLVIRAQQGSIGSLKRLGIEVKPVTAAQDALKASHDKVTKAELDAAKAADKQATAQAAVGALQQKFGGQAEAYGKTAAGAADRLGVAWENVQESIGQKVLPRLTQVFNFLSEHIDLILRVGGALGGIALGALAVSKAVNTWKTAQKALNAVMEMSPLGRVVTVLSLIATGLVLAWQHSKTFRDVARGAFGVVKTIANDVWTVIQGIGDAIDYVISRLPFMDVGGRRAQSAANLATSSAGRVATASRQGPIQLPTKPVQGPPAPGKGNVQGVQEFDRRTPLEIALTQASTLASVGDRALGLAQKQASEAAQKAAAARGVTNPEKLADIGEQAMNKEQRRVLQAAAQVALGRLKRLVQQQAKARSNVLKAARAIPAPTSKNKAAVAAAKKKRADAQHVLGDYNDRVSGAINELADIKAQLRELGFDIGEMDQAIGKLPDVEPADDTGATDTTDTSTTTTDAGTPTTTDAGIDTTSADSLIQAQLDQAFAAAASAARGQAASDAILRTFTGSGDIGSGGQSAFGAAFIQINQMLHPDDPAVLLALAKASNAGNLALGYAPATSGSAGI